MIFTILYYYGVPWSVPSATGIPISFLQNNFSLLGLTMAGGRRIFEASLAILSILFVVLSTYYHHGSTDTRELIKLESRDLELLPFEDSLPNHSNLSRRQDYSCSANRPCSNGACCGSSGFCGYGQTYCGAGCQSNCDAFAECGVDSIPSGKTCPLNTCCSEFGFCGTTEVSLGQRLGRSSCADRAGLLYGQMPIEL